MGKEEKAAKPPISFIVCHKDSDALPELRGSIDANIGRTGQIEIVPVIGAESIAEGYNEGARRAQGQMLVFAHSDLEVFASSGIFTAACNQAGLPHAGVVGVAGCRILRDDAVWWSAKGEMSGSCMHRDPQKMWMTAFGPYGRVAVLDGVFLMTRRFVFDVLDGFDESFPGWDYYDIDFTMRAHLAGFVNTTFPIHLLHHSVGDTSGKQGWHDNKVRFQEKWKHFFPVVIPDAPPAPPRAEEKPSG